MTDKATDYRATLNMMDTPFPMRGDLPKREPAWAKQWNERGLASFERAMAANEALGVRGRASLGDRRTFERRTLAELGSEDMECVVELGRGRPDVTLEIAARDGAASAVHARGALHERAESRTGKLFLSP